MSPPKSYAVVRERMVFPPLPPGVKEAAVAGGGQTAAGASAAALSTTFGAAAAASAPGRALDEPHVAAAAWVVESLRRLNRFDSALHSTASDQVRACEPTKRQEKRRVCGVCVGGGGGKPDGAILRARF